MSKFDSYCTRQGTDQVRPTISLVGLICAGDGGNTPSIPWLLHDQKHTREVILVANGMNANHINYLSFFKDVATVIQAWKNLGVVAKNLGYMVAAGDLIFSIDSDVIAPPEAIDKCVAYMGAHPEAWLIGPCGGRLEPDKWTNDSWPVRPDYPGTCFGFEDWLDYSSQSAVVDGTKVDVIPSLFWCFRRSVLEKIGYLNWRYGPFVGSDSDFCFRIKEAGGEVHVVRSRVSHVNGGGKSHNRTGKHMLDYLRKKHVAWLFEDWYPKREKVLHRYLGG